ncbi:hypothetical protein [Enterobacter kobei]|uniref:hypothetical protein n=1 Tax=Enterobacter kobei TaxID=208224 RepID=UPI0039BEA4FC
MKQAQYNFVGASEQLESAHRNVVQTVRSSFNNVNASISSALTACGLSVLKLSTFREASSG